MLSPIPRPSVLALVRSALVPGLPYLGAGRRAVGLSFLFFDLFCWIVLVERWDAVVLSFGSGELDLILAAVTLLAVLGGMRVVSVRFQLRKALTREEKQSYWNVAMRQFRRNRMAVLGVITLCFLYLVTLLTPFLA